ncbi:sigma-E factor negative regulatory protein [Comamonadaceae bacterium OTU4NAUVB1]|nr:sigma-E factor negative regulatory protein [Comamonadaceae bacterium OTU4NAUVB1]
MNPSDESSREQISALADGALHGQAMTRTIEALCAQRSMQQVWQDHHAVGDLLRAGARRPCTDNAAFLERFQQRLAAEPASIPVAVAAPVSSVVQLPVRQPVTTVAGRIGRNEAANEPVFRWKLVAGVASLAAVAAIGWNLVGGVGLPASGSQLAQQQAQPAVQTASREAPLVVPVAASPNDAFAAGEPQTQVTTRVAAGAGEPQVMLRDARLDQLLEAHRQAGGAAQMPSGFLRNATFDGPSR